MKVTRDLDLYLISDGGTAGMAKAVSAEAPSGDPLRRFEEMRVPLRRYLLCGGASPADADDAIQETFLRLHRHLEKRGDQSNLAGWVFQVARNYLRDERKSARLKRTVQLDDTVTEEGGPADPQGSPEGRALHAERAQRLRAAIQRLPEQQREVMLLRASGLRYREIAEILKMTTSGVGTLVHRAVARLSEDLA